MDKVYLISKLRKVLWNCYFLSKLLFKSLYYLRVPNFSKQLYPLARVTFSEDAVFQTNYFSTADLVFTVTLCLYHLVISPTNTGVFKLEIPGCSKRGAPLRKSFH